MLDLVGIPRADCGYDEKIVQGESEAGINSATELKSGQSLTSFFEPALPPYERWLVPIVLALDPRADVCIG